jgi:hypothetical protein
VLEGKLGGMRYPQREDELGILTEKFRIGLIVSLTEQPIQCITNTNETLKRVRVVHYPISGR